MKQTSVLSVPGHAFGDGVIRAITCAPGLERAMEIPGEPKPWRVSSCQRAFDGGLEIPAHSIVVVEAAVRPGGKCRERRQVSH